MKLLKLYLSAMFLGLIVACENSSSKKQKPDSLNHISNEPTIFVVKTSDSVIIIRGTYQKNQKVGLWEHFDEDGQLLSTTEYLDASNPKKKKLKFYNSFGRLIYIENYLYDGSNPERLFILHSNDTSSNRRIAEILNKEYCISCHDVNSRLVSKSYKELIGDNQKEYSKIGIERFFSETNKENHKVVLALISKEEVKDIVDFVILDKERPIPNAR